MPEKIIKNVQADWEPVQYDLYRTIKNEMRAIVCKDGLPHEDNAEEILKRLLRLVQITSNPKLIDESYCEEPGKLDTLLDIITSAIGVNEKCIVWTNFIENVDWLTRILKEFGTVKIHGSMSISERNKSVDAFLSNAEKRILIATPASAKEGLTLTVANHAIFYDRNFSLDDYLQAQDRIHRISQEKTCYVYNIVIHDSIDEWVDSLLHAKHLAAKLTQGDIDLDTYRINMSYDFGKMINEILS